MSPGVRADFAETMKGQDLLTLLTVPVLLVAGHHARRGSLVAHLVGLGLLLYYAYTYVIYAVSPFNDAFLLYVATIGLASYGLLDGLMRLEIGTVAPAVVSVPRRLVAGFLIAVGVLFVALWLAMILPAVVGEGLPDGRVTYDIPSAVHVLDLSLVLPLLIGTGVMLLRRRTAGAVLAVVLLTKMVTLGLALLAMSYAFQSTRSPGEALLWTGIALVSTTFLVLTARRVEPVQEPWMRESIWR